jgi:hydrogenase nickel incorporation protein HypA/HybF
VHEFVYADRILQSVLEELRANPRPSKVKVEVGEMLGLTRESLSTAYEVLAKGTRAEGSRLVVKFEEGSVECPRCGFSGRMAVRRHEHKIDPAFACPNCGSSLKIRLGLEVKLIGFE